MTNRACKKRRCWQSAGVAAGLLLMLASLPAQPAAAQAHHWRRRPDNSDSTDSGPSASFPTAAAFDAQQSKFESDLATMLEQRAAAPSPALDFQIDMDVLARWLTEQASAAAPRSPMQVCAYLRAAELSRVSGMLSAKLSAAALTQGQTEALAKLHKMTFKLPDLKNVGKMDEFCKDLAIALIGVNGPLPAGMHNVPFMRPQPIEAPAGGPAPPPAPPPTLAQLVDVAAHAAVSPALHTQLVELGNDATAAANDPAGGDEAADLSAMLQQVTELATGLQANTGVDADQRAKMEQALTDGVALFADSRTRSAGRKRIETLDQYRQNLGHIRNLNLPHDLSAKFAAAFVFADQNPDTGNQVMEAVQKWVALTAAFDHHAPPAGLNSNQLRLVEAMQKQFAMERNAFLTDAGNLTPNPGATFATSPADLQAHLPKMQSAIDTTRLIEQANVAETALLAYNPRPADGLEHRVNGALATLADDLRIPAERMTQRQQERRDEAQQFLGDMERLAQSAADASAGTAGISDAVAQNWAGGKLADFQSKRSDLIIALVNEAASNKAIDGTTLDRLDRAKALIAGLHDLAGVQAGLDQIPSLSRWADWSIAQADMQTILGPVRDASSGAVAGFIGDDDDSLRNWATVRDHYAPLLQLVASAGTYATQCNALPGDSFGEIAKLSTPMDDQPFADERFASLCIGLWSAYNQVPDAGSADAMVQAMLKPVK